VRILLAASGGEGHLGPLLPFAAAAREAGDDVVAVVPPAQEATVRSAGLRYELTAAVDPTQLQDVRLAMGSGDWAMRVRAAEVELFGRLHTQAALPTMEAVASAFVPDLVLREPCDYASAIVAARSGIRMAQVGISPGLADVSGLRLASEVVEPLALGVTALVESSPYLTRFPSNGPSGFADTRRYGFPVSYSGRCEEDPPLVWLTMGTVNSGFEQGKRTWDVALAAVAGLPVHVLASVGRGGVHLPAPANVDVVDSVNLADVLSKASMVICHGGSGTTLAALAAAVPLVIVPMLADQPANAALVERLGAGITVAPASAGVSAGVSADTPGGTAASTAASTPAGTLAAAPTPPDRINGLSMRDVPRLRAAINAVLSDDRYRRSARNAAEQFALAKSVTERLDEFR